MVYPGQSDNQTAPLLRAIRESLSDVLVTMAIAALIGALMLWLLPGFATAGLSDLTMEQLNREVDEALRWLQLGWYLPLLAGAGLVGLGLAGWGAVSQRHSRTIAATLGWALKAKAVAGLLVAFSFVGWAWKTNARETVEDGRQALKELRELRLALATENTHVAIEVMAETIADVLPGQQRLAITAENFVQVAPSLPHADRVTPLDLATQLERRLPDLSTTAARSALDTAVTARGASLRPEQALMKKVLEASFDNTVGTPARDALLAIDNPLINELVGAFIDPIVAVPVREWIVGLAMDELRRGGDGRARRERAGALWAQASDALRAPP